MARVLLVLSIVATAFAQQCRNNGRLCNRVCYTCPTGYQVSPDCKQCVCAAGTKLCNGKCLQCPPGYSLNRRCDKCIRTSCPNGGKLCSQQCLSCRKDYILTNCNTNSPKCVPDDTPIECSGGGCPQTRKLTQIAPTVEQLLPGIVGNDDEVITPVGLGGTTTAVTPTQV